MRPRSHGTGRMSEQPYRCRESSRVLAATEGKRRLASDVAQVGGETCMPAAATVRPCCADPWNKSWKRPAMNRPQRDLGGLEIRVSGRCIMPLYLHRTRRLAAYGHVCLCSPVAVAWQGLPVCSRPEQKNTNRLHTRSRHRQTKL
jgi:hypothetical protein